MTRIKRLEDLEQRILRRVHFEPGTNCWIWQGSKRGGYGCIRIEGKTRSVHSIIYELIKGAIEPNEIDHLCRNPACCNPAHLEAVPHAINCRRSPLMAAARTHCPRGHPYDEKNTYRHNGKRYCRKCWRCGSRARKINHERSA